MFRLILDNLRSLWPSPQQRARKREYARRWKELKARLMPIETPNPSPFADMHREIMEGRIDDQTR